MSLTGGRAPVVGPDNYTLREQLFQIRRALDALGLVRGKGSPEGVLAAKTGTLYVNESGGASTTLYVKESGTGKTGWVAK